MQIEWLNDRNISHAKKNIYHIRLTKVTMLNIR